MGTSAPQAFDHKKFSAYEQIFAALDGFTFGDCEEILESFLREIRDARQHNVFRKGWREELAARLSCSDPENDSMSLIRIALKASRHELVTLSGLRAFDEGDSREVFTINSSEVLSMLDRALASTGQAVSEPALDSGG